MEIGIYGLGRMGANMVRRLAESEEHRVIAGNRSPEPVDRAVEQGAEGAYSLEEFVGTMDQRPRVLWSMLPAGDVTGKVIRDFADLVDEGDIIVDGANSYFRDSVSRAEEMRERGLK